MGKPETSRTRRPTSGERLEHLRPRERGAQSRAGGSAIPPATSSTACSHVRFQGGSAQFFTPPLRTAPIVGAHSKRQDPKTPVEQALMRGLGTA
jgi:hypothetical protein